MASFDDDSQYNRPKEGFRFTFHGLKTNVVADACPPDKYPYAQNVRATREHSTHTRPGMAALFPASVLPAPQPVTDIHSYTQLSTDNLPRFLARCLDDRVWLGRPGNTSALAGSLIPAVPSPSPGASMIPLRPAQSPSPYMYVANGTDYQKFSAPATGTDAITQQNVGIAEPQAPPEASIEISFIRLLQGINPGYSLAGSATGGAVTNRTNDTVIAALVDPAVSPSNLWSIQVPAASHYSPRQDLTIGGSPSGVEDVFQPITIPINVRAIYYFTGTAGRCVIVPAAMGGGPGVNGESVSDQNILASLRRGALIQLTGGATETVYVWSVVLGPDGTICIETSTLSAHNPGESFTVLPAISCVATSPPTFGQSLVTQQFGFLVGTGIGTVTSTLPFANSLFSDNNYVVQPDDYILFQMNVDNLTNLNEIKLLFDVGDGSFTQNFFFYTIRPSDIVAGIANTLTQLGAAQLVTQRATIDEETAAAAHNQLQTSSSAQTAPGSSQWSEVLIPISSFTRVGNDQTKSLQTVVKQQVLVNANANINMFIGAICACGTDQPDVGPSGAPYLYRVRPRSSLTGAKGNPSPAMRYGVNPRRQRVTVGLPLANDPQIDTWDIFRYGGTVTSWRKIGQSPSTAAFFFDRYDDTTASAGELLEEDNLQPWPSIMLPINVTGTATGFAVVFTVIGSNGPSSAQVLRLLPGNLIRIGGINVYTLQTRPTVVTTISGGTVINTYTLSIIENAGSQVNVPIQIYEPLIAQQRLPYMWGPDAAGTIFATGDPLRPGTLSFTKNYGPDSAPDAYNIEITSPSEPLLGGEVIDGLSFAASPERWWALYPQPSNPLQRYSVIQQPIPRGLAAPFGHCTDGKSIYFWAKDGIWSSSKGSLTDADLYNIFPHEGIPGSNYTYFGNTVFAPDYSRSGTFRLTYRNSYLFAVYQDSTGVYRTLTLDTRSGAWCVDALGANQNASTYFAPAQPEGTLLSSTALYPSLVAGTIQGTVLQESPNTGDNGSPIPITLCTMEWDAGDIRAGEQWGDLWLDVNPTAAISITPVSLGAQASPAVGIVKSSSRVQTPVSLGGELTTDYLGIMIVWVDYVPGAGQTSPTILHAWQPSFIVKPEITADRVTDWFDGDTEAAKYIQGFLLHADTSNVPKSVVVRDSDTLTTHPYAPSPIQHNGESIKAYSFNSPFIAHQVRLEPSDQLPWRVFDFILVFEPTPEQAQTWQTQGTAFGLTGYMHVKQVSPCYASTSPVTLTITSYDGQSPAVITLPATGGAMQKLAIMLTANKGSLYFFAATSSAPFQLFLDSWEIMVGQWMRQDNYLRYRSLGAPTGDQARV